MTVLDSRILKYLLVDSGYMTEIPSKIVKLDLTDWYGKLSDTDKVKMNRYLDKADDSSAFAFFLSMIKAASADENYKFGLMLCIATNDLTLNAYERFQINEEFIDVLIGRKMYDDAKNVCDINLTIYPIVKDMVLAANGGVVPEKLNFRNRYIDLIVGIECQYDKAYEMLDKYCEMGLISEEDLAYRKNSLMTHRLQRTFDGIFTYRPKGECEAMEKHYSR